MNTFAFFPSLLDYMLLGPLLLRLAVSVFILHLGFQRYKKRLNWTLIFYVGVPILLILGLYTQISSLLGIAVLKFDIYTNFWSKRKEEKVPMNIYMLYGMAGVILLSFLVTGPGFLAFDLPF